LRYIKNKEYIHIKKEYYITIKKSQKNQKRYKRYMTSTFPSNDTIAYLGKKRYPSKNEHYCNKASNTAKSGDSEKYKKKYILRNKKVSAPKQNLLIMKWDPPIRINFD